MSTNNPAVTAPVDHDLLYASRTTSNRYRGEDQNERTQQPDLSDDGPARTPEEDPEVPALTKYEMGWRRIVRNFSPSWFSVTMGTGVVAILLATLPFQAQWLHYLSIVFFVLNTVLWTLAFIVSVLRYTLYPAIWTVMLRDPNNSLFLGTIPMGFATLIRMWVIVCVPVWGPWAVTFAWILWMVDSIAAFAATVWLSFSLVSRHGPSSLERITAAQLLPISATIIASVTGAAVVEVLPNKQHALGTLLTCIVMWGMSVPLALTVMVMYYQRLAVHKLPSREVIVSSFLPLGPLGYGGFGILYHGRLSISIFAETNTLPSANGLAGPIFYTIAFLLALIFWGFGVIWLFLALGSIYKSRPVPFNMGWWGFTFPLGVFAASTIAIGKEVPSAAFRVLGTVFAVVVVCLWVVVAGGTAHGAWTGKLFFAPCLANLERVRGEEKLKRKREEGRAETTGSSAV